MKKSIITLVVLSLIISGTIYSCATLDKNASAEIKIDPVTPSSPTYSFYLDIDDVDYSRFYVVATFDGRVPTYGDYDKLYHHSEKINRKSDNGYVQIWVSIFTNDRWADRPVEVYCQNLRYSNIPPQKSVKFSGKNNSVLNLRETITSTKEYSYKIGCNVMSPYSTYGTYVINNGIQNNDKFFEEDILQLSHMFIGCINPLSSTDTKALHTSRTYISDGYIYGVPYKPVNLNCIWLYFGQFNMLGEYYSYPDWDVKAKVQYIVNGGESGYNDAVLKKGNGRDSTVLYEYCIDRKDMLRYIEQGYYIQSIEFSIMSISRQPVPDPSNVNTYRATEVLIVVVLNEELQRIVVDDIESGLTYLQNTVNGTLKMLNVPIYKDITLLNIFATILIFGMVVFIFRITGVV